MATNSVRKSMKKAFELDREWYSLRSILGNDWAMFYILLGGREAGKSYAVTEKYVHQFIKYGRPFYWMRLSEESAKKLLTNNAEKLVDPDIRRKYNLDLTTIDSNVYNVTKRNKDGRIREKKLMARVLSISTYYNDKGSGLFDKDFLNDPLMYYNICLDEMNREQNERKSFDIVYSFTNQLENLVRSTKKRIRVICIGNTLDEASDLLCAFNFIPEKFGRYYLKSKRCVIDYIEPTQKYLTRRKGTIADILSPTASTFTNKIDVDTTLIRKNQKLYKPEYIIVFNKDEKYTVWNNNLICPFNNEKIKQIAMRPYIDGMIYDKNLKDTVFAIFDARGYTYRNLITQKKFKKSLELAKPRKNG